MLEFLLAVAVGVLLLVWGADRFVVGAAATARNLGVSPLVIGLTVVGVGTSAPEMLVAATAAWSGKPGIAIGNAVGSNIANIGLVVGMTALVIPLSVSSKTLRRELPMMFGIIALAGALLIDGRLSRYDGVGLLIGFGALLAFMVFLALRARESDPLGTEYAEEIPKGLRTGAALLWLALGLVILILSARLVVWGAANVASTLGISDLVIGLTIVAIGTSLPELAASIMSAVKGEPDIAIGNVIGSNMFNLLPVLGIPGVIHPTVVEADVLYRDFPVMLVLSIALFGMAYGFSAAGRINRVEGGALLLAFVAYQYLLYVSSV